MKKLRLTLVLLICACGDAPGQSDGGRDASFPDSSFDASLDDGGASDAGGPVTPADFSRIGQAAIGALEAFPAERHTGWNYSADAVLVGDWVLQTPPAGTWGAAGVALALPAPCPGDRPGCHPDFELQECAAQSDCGGGGICRPVAATVTAPGEAPTSLCTGHSDQLYDEVYAAMIEAEEFVDYMTLSPFTGRFAVAIRNALTYLQNSGRSVQVRILMGIITATDLAVNTDDILADITRDLTDGDLRVSVAAYRVGAFSWNHAKIVAVDGRLLIQGGHNHWEDHYLSFSPVHDISMRIEGETAADAHRFANVVWRYACTDPRLPSNTKLDSYPSTGPSCPPEYVPPIGGLTPTGLRVVTLARFGHEDIGVNPADAVLPAIIESAETVLRFSLQDLGPFRIAGITFDDWPEAILLALGRAMARGVDVYIVFNTNDARPGGLGRTAAYGTGWATEDSALAIIDALDANPDVIPAGTTAHDLVCERLHLTTLRFAPGEDTWPDGANIANHAKFFVIDDQAFYMGSQNLYQSQLAEFSLLVDDEPATRTILSEYWEPMWAQSSRAAISGAGVTCTY